MHYFVSILILQSSWRGRESCLQMYCYCKRSVALPHGAMARSAVYDFILLIILTYFLPAFLCLFLLLSWIWSVILISLAQTNSRYQWMLVQTLLKIKKQGSIVSQIWHLRLRPTLAIIGYWLKLCRRSRNKVQSYLKSGLLVIVKVILNTFVSCHNKAR